jgi:VWFA-related protein
LRCTIAVLTLFVTLQLHAQAPASLPAAVPTLRSSTTLVVVPALVKTHIGAPVFTLKASDFELADDGVPQPVMLDEDTGAEPMAIAVVVQTGGLGGRQLDKYRGLPRFLDQLAGGIDHRIALVEFDSEPRLAAPFTSDLATVREALDGLGPGDRHAAILDALQFAVDLLARQPPAYRRVILLLSETVDRSSQTSLDAALRSLSRTNTSIYALAFPSARSAAADEAGRILNDPTPGPAHGCMARDASNQDVSRAEQSFDCLGLLAPPLRLAKAAFLAARSSLARNIPETAAHLSGGEYFSFGNAHAVDRAFDAITHHLPNRYVLSFTPPAPHSGFHTLAVRLRDHPDLQIEARNGYWAEEPAGAQSSSSPSR